MASARFMAGRRGGAVPAVILAAVLAIGAAACSSSSSAATSTASGASPASTATVTGAAATALITKAIANTKAAPSLQVVGSGISSGSTGSSSTSSSSSSTSSGSQQVSFDLTLVQKAGCRGTIALSTVESFQLVETGGYVWLKPTSAFDATLHLSQAALALVAGKYIKLPTDASQVADLAKICSFSGLFSELPTPTGTSYTATPTTYNGKSAYKVTRRARAGYAYITNSSTPVLAKIAEPTATGGVIAFTEYSQPQAITAPSAAESIDGTQLGI